MHVSKLFDSGCRAVPRSRRGQTGCCCWETDMWEPDPQTRDTIRRTEAGRREGMDSGRWGGRWMSEWSQVEEGRNKKHRFVLLVLLFLTEVFVKLESYLWKVQINYFNFNLTQINNISSWATTWTPCWASPCSKASSKLLVQVWGAAPRGPVGSVGGGWRSRKHLNTRRRSAPCLNLSG